MEFDERREQIYLEEGPEELASDRPVLSMATTMLAQAFETIPDGTGPILHSDQGWQYQRMLKAKIKGLPPAVHRQQALPFCGNPEC